LLDGNQPPTEFEILDVEEGSSMKLETQKSPAWVIALAIYAIGLGLGGLATKPGRLTRAPVPAQPKPAPASSPKRPSHNFALASAAHGFESDMNCYPGAPDEWHVAWRSG